MRKLWSEAAEIGNLGKRRAVGILQALAEEEAAKALILFDVVRCPDRRIDERRRLIKGFDEHLAKGIYSRFYDTRPATLAEVKGIVDRDRTKFYREGEYGEYIAPNYILFWRENRLYVDFVREADNSHRWQIPLAVDLLWGTLIPSGSVRVVNALAELNLFSETGLTLTADYWVKIEMNDGRYGSEEEAKKKEIGWLQLRNANLEYIDFVNKKGVEYFEKDLPAIREVIEGLLYPLYPFDLTGIDNFRELPGPDYPDFY